MIITITLNPAIDRTIHVDNIILGGVNRCKNASVDIGGKGINVSRAIKAIGGESVCIGFCGTVNGRVIKNKLTSEDIHHDFTDAIGNVRTNIKIIDTQLNHTEIHEEGFSISDSDFLRFLDRLELYLDKNNVFVLSGSVPGNFSSGNYKKICSRISKSGAKLIIDGDAGELLSVFDKKPYFAKQEQMQASIISGINISSPEDAIIAAKKISSMGPMITCISMGENGAVFYKEGERALYIKHIDKGHIAFSTNSHDSMIGGFVHSLVSGYDFEKCCKMCVASWIASAGLVGNTMPTLKEVFDIYNKLQVYID